MDADIIRMAREAGLMTVRLSRALEQVRLGQLARFAALVRAAEREACARVCDFEVARLIAIDEPRPALAVGICAAAIRARNHQPPATVADRLARHGTPTPGDNT